MKTTLVTKLPKQQNGDLKLKKHSLELLVEKEDDCGSHGCTGHTYYALMCSCGFISDINHESIDTISIARRHTVEVICEQLDLVFENLA